MVDTSVTDRVGLHILCYFIFGTVTTLAYLGKLDFFPHLLADVIIILIIGALASFRNDNPDAQVDNSPSSTEPTKKQTNVETLSKSDAIQFPFIASAALLSLYAVFKYIPEDYVMPVVDVYFCVVGFFLFGAGFKSLGSVLFSFIGNGDSVLFWISYPIMFDISGMAPTGIKIHFTEPSVDEAASRIDMWDIIFLVISAPVSYFYYNTKHWIVNNLYGFFFCIQALVSVRPGTFQITVLILWALFFYDIFWVFGTDVMVTVAKKFDGPIKLLFPKFASERPSLLGLGDIVLPGFLVSQMARFDCFLHFKNNPEDTSVPALSGNYFWVSLLFYFFGMVTTLVSMLYFNAAQPALLYLVPATTISVSLFALIRGEFTLLWNFDDGAKDLEAEKANKED